MDKPENRTGNRRFLFWLTTPIIAVLGVLMLLRNTRSVAWSAEASTRSGRSVVQRLRELFLSAASVAAETRPVQAMINVITYLDVRENSDEPEWMDLPGRNPAELAKMFDDLHLVNKYFAGTSLTARALEEIIPQTGRETTRVLDVASGSADIPRDIASWARDQGYRLEIVATDINPEILDVARRQDGAEKIHLEEADARNLPYDGGSFDVAMCSLVLHHLPPEDVVSTLKEMKRVSCRGVLINDLIRTWPAFIGAWLGSRIVTRNPISRHDAPLSARRAYTVDEMTELMRRADLKPVIIHRALGYRVAIVAR